MSGARKFIVDGALPKLVAWLADGRNDVNDGAGTLSPLIGSVIVNHDVAFLRAILRRADVDPNARVGRQALTPLLLAISAERREHVEVLLGDRRVLTAHPDSGPTALWLACHKADRWLMLDLIRSGKDLYFHRLCTLPTDQGVENVAHKPTSALEVGLIRAGSGVAGNNLSAAVLNSTFDRYQRNPRALCHSLRAAAIFRAPPAQVAELLALVIFFADGHFALAREEIFMAQRPQGRFFLIAGRLPLELQMLLCNKARRSISESVLEMYLMPALCYLASLAPQWARDNRKMRECGVPYPSEWSCLSPNGTPESISLTDCLISPCSSESSQEDVVEF